MKQNTPVILLARELPEAFNSALSRLGEVRLAGQHPDTAMLEGATVYLATGVDPVSAELIARFPASLGLIANVATGTDNIDLEAAAARGLSVSNTPVVAEDTADLTMALLLATCRRLSFCERALRDGRWDLGAGHLGSRVHGKALGIVGMGAIGQAVARRAAAFGMTIYYHGPNRKPQAEAELGVEYRATLGELLAASDIVSLNCPLTPASRHLINAETLQQMQAGAVLINTGRGPLVDEQALVAALDSGHLSAAGLDVFEFEPAVTPQLLTFDNVTLLPHIGSATAECRSDMAMRAIANIQHFHSEGKPLDNCVKHRAQPKPVYRITTMSDAKRSDIISASASPLMNLFRKGLLHGAGYNTERIARRPLIAIANSHAELTTGHTHLGLLAQRVRDGIIAAGGEAAEFNVPAPCDGVAMAHDGMRFVLAQRDLIADTVETHVRSQPYDGVVFIASCDKINPGMMMAMARLDLPSIYLSGGPGQMNIRNSSAPAASIDHGDHQADPDKLYQSLTCSTCGACEIMGTANTFQCLAEVLGICVPGSANIPGWHADKLEAARVTGERVVEMVHEGLNARRLLTAAAFDNAVKTAMAIGGSTNTLLHLPAIAHSAGLELPVSSFAAAGDIPTLLAVSPNGPWGMQDVWAAGGMPAILKQIQSLLDTSTLTAMGVALQEVVDAAEVTNPEVIPPLDRAFRPSAGIAVLHGNLAPDSCVIKAAGVHESMMVCSGPARCFDSEEDALHAIDGDVVQQGEVLVLRYQGPRGAPGMPEMLGATIALKSRGLAKTALITDGRFSGATSGPCVGHICPEASDGGVIALVQDGDIIDIDIPARSIKLAVSDEELERRRRNWQALEKEVPEGYMRRYRKHVRPACEGAILD